MTEIKSKAVVTALTVELGSSVEIEVCSSDLGTDVNLFTNSPLNMISGVMLDQVSGIAKSQSVLYYASLDSGKLYIKFH